MIDPAATLSWMRRLVAHFKANALVMSPPTHTRFASLLPELADIIEIASDWTYGWMLRVGDREVSVEKAIACR